LLAPAAVGAGSVVAELAHALASSTTSRHDSQTFILDLQ
jgi:hypothetical protein